MEMIIVNHLLILTSIIQSLQKGFQVWTQAEKKRSSISESLL